MRANDQANTLYVAQSSTEQSNEEGGAENTKGLPSSPGSIWCDIVYWWARKNMKLMELWGWVLLFLSPSSTSSISAKGTTTTFHWPQIYALSTFPLQEIQHLDYISHFTSNIRHIQRSCNTPADALFCIHLESNALLNSSPTITAHGSSTTGHGKSDTGHRQSSSTACIPYEILNNICLSMI